MFCKWAPQGVRLVIYSHQGELSLAIPPWVGAMSTDLHGKGLVCG